MRKKGIPEDLVRSVTRLHKAAKTRVRVDFELSDEFEVKESMHQGYMLSRFPFALMIDVAIERALGDLLYVGDLVLMSETFKLLRNKFVK